jgi:hypothetical protein
MVIPLIVCGFILLIASIAATLSRCCCFSDKSVKYVKI